MLRASPAVPASSSRAGAGAALCVGVESSAKAADIA